MLSTDTRPTSAPCIVWDWNGTLYDDRKLLLTSVEATLHTLGLSALSQDEIIASFRRPMRAFVDAILDRTLTDMEWNLFDETFENTYLDNLGSAALVPGAMQALCAARRRTAEQHLVSLWPHDHLVEVLCRYGLTSLFEVVRGRRDPRQTKSAMIAELLAERRVHPGEVYLIGDTRDDAAAAKAAGAKAVLVTGASLEELDERDAHAAGAELTRSIEEAVEHVCRI